MAFINKGLIITLNSKRNEKCPGRGVMINTALSVGYAVSGTYMTSPDDKQLIYSATATYTDTAYLINILYVMLSPALEAQMG